MGMWEGWSLVAAPAAATARMEVRASVTRRRWRRWPTPRWGSVALHPSTLAAVEMFAAFLERLDRESVVDARDARASGTP